MNTTQKMIKYIAMGFGLFLAINIIFGIFTAVVSILGITSMEYREMNGNAGVQQFEQVYQNIENLEIEIGVANFNIVEGDQLKVLATNITNSFTCQNQNGTLVLKEKKMNFNALKDKASQITIYIPKDQVFKEVDITTGVGNNKIQTFACENLKLEIGVGKFYGTDMSASKKTSISGGVGQVEMKNASFTKTNLDVGVGSFDFEGDMLGDTTINCGVGKADFVVNHALEDYQITADSGIGGIYVNDIKMKEDSSMGTGSNDFHINGGVGKISIHFTK